MKTKKRILSLALAAAVSLSMFVPAAAASPTFTDIPTTHWAYAYVEKAASAGYVSGIGDNKYNPSGTVTYAELCTMLVNAFQEDNLEQYESWCKWLGKTSEAWYDAYMWSAQYGGMLVDTKADSSSLGTFPDGIATTAINRYEMAQIMYNIMSFGTLEYMGGTAPPDAEISAARASIADWSSVPSNYQDAVAYCYAAGFLSGVDSKGTFSGTSTMDRAQAATVMCNLYNLDANGNGSGNNSGNNQGTETGTATGSKDANGYTTAASVNSVQNRNKSDAYPTKGNSDTVSVNGYYTGSTVDVGDSVLVYDFLDMVNEARKAEGLNELEWVESDAAEEYTLVWAFDIAKSFSHFGQHAGMGYEVIAGGYSAEEVFQSWMNSEGHRTTLMYDNVKYMSAAKNGTRWIISLWVGFDIKNAENQSTDYLLNAAKNN